MNIEGGKMSPDKKLSIKNKFIFVFECLIFSREQIIDLIEQAYPNDTKRRSIIPSDYCYNFINADPASFKIHLFEMLGKAKYKYLGLDFPYTGKILWEEKGKGKEVEVGSWLNGIYELQFDPSLKK